MQHYRSLDPVSLNNAWLTIGSFDGVHRGHQILISRLVEQAHAAGDPAAVVTFFPHPVKVLRGLSGRYYLTGPEERARLLSALGVDAVITLTFDLELASQTAETFMRNLAEHTRLRQLWIGPGFALGKGREGSADRLRQLGEQMGYRLTVMESVTVDGEMVSSSQIRHLLQQGQVREAARLLGRDYSLLGPVIPGDARGRRIGIPTANLGVWEEKIIPANGVYATRAVIDGEVIASVTSVGVNPTFENQPENPRVEAHLLDFNGDLYGRQLEVQFVERLREEIRFSTVEALVNQIQQDIHTAKEILDHAR